jgi:uncharacterized protein
VPLVIAESSSDDVDRLLAADSEVTIWWATRVECASAVARRERTGGLTPEEAGRALQRFAELVGRWNEVPPGERLREIASRLVRVHELGAADAFQLAAAITAAEDRSETLGLVTLDNRLAGAAGREGFRVLPD